MNGKE